MWPWTFGRDPLISNILCLQYFFASTNSFFHLVPVRVKLHFPMKLKFSPCMLFSVHWGTFAFSFHLSPIHSIIHSILVHLLVLLIDSLRLALRATTRDLVTGWNTRVTGRLPEFSLPLVNEFIGWKISVRLNLSRIRILKIKILFFNVLCLNYKFYLRISFSNRPVIFR